MLDRRILTFICCNFANSLLSNAPMTPFSNRNDCRSLKHGIISCSICSDENTRLAWIDSIRAILSLISAVYLPTWLIGHIVRFWRVFPDYWDVSIFAYGIIRQVRIWDSFFFQNRSTWIRRWIWRLRHLWRRSEFRICISLPIMVCPIRCIVRSDLETPSFITE